ncbi:hypothetical protein Vretifemale_10581 [Volvox reticuliferus]|uniref:Uncharacterized protein n=1 Tax=Volvox reticuliferus TaxID=1737510 RepID=A0A8J4CIA7_9CHLO|nr:hypothetical protein Vretifemale_10581 [Volvox reticuliferus]
MGLPSVHPAASVTFRPPSIKHQGTPYLGPPAPSGCCTSGLRRLRTSSSSFTLIRMHVPRLTTACPGFVDCFLRPQYPTIAEIYCPPSHGVYHLRRIMMSFSALSPLELCEGARPSTRPPPGTLCAPLLLTSGLLRLRLHFLLDKPRFPAS